MTLEEQPMATNFANTGHTTGHQRRGLARHRSVQPRIAQRSLQHSVLRDHEPARAPDNGATTTAARPSLTSPLRHA